MAKYKKYFKNAFVFIVLFFPTKNLYAGSLLSGISCIKEGDCGLNDMVLVAVKVTDILLALSGSVALLFFVYGGVIFLISGGSTERVSKGKQIITNAVIGLIIVFISFMIIDFSMKALGYTDLGFGAWNQSN